MERNFNKCPHCGQIFGGIGNGISVINRSDGATFHLMLFSGPYPRPNVSGGFHRRQIMCTFAYANDRTAPEKDFLVVAIIDPKEDRAEEHRQLEDAADKVADLLALSKKLRPTYTFERGQLSPGLPE